MSEYEKREAYDDVDGVYAAYWIKKLAEDSSKSIPELSNYVYGTDSVGGDVRPNDCSVFEPAKKAICDKIAAAYQFGLSRTTIGQFYIVNYNIDDFKKDIVDHTDPELEDYLNSLPDYNNYKNNTYGSNFRVILSMKRGYKDIEGTSHTYMAYSNMEGNK